jgi:hypothetical protein
MPRYTPSVISAPHWLPVIDEPRRSELREMVDLPGLGPTIRWENVNPTNEIMVQLIVDLRRLCEVLHSRIEFWRELLKDHKPHAAPDAERKEDEAG